MDRDNCSTVFRNIKEQGRTLLYKKNIQEYKRTRKNIIVKTNVQEYKGTRTEHYWIKIIVSQCSGIQRNEEECC